MLYIKEEEEKEINLGEIEFIVKLNIPSGVWEDNFMLCASSKMFSKRGVLSNHDLRFVPEIWSRFRCN
jgi:hypothetical protein